MLIQNTLGLSFAVLLHRRGAARGSCRRVHDAYLVSPIVIGYLWSLLLYPRSARSTPRCSRWGSGRCADAVAAVTRTALPVAIVVNAWQWVGFPMLLFAAALAGIPDEYEQAARVDGASSLAGVPPMTFPLLTPVMGIVRS